MSILETSSHRELGRLRARLSSWGTACAS